LDSKLECPNISLEADLAHHAAPPGSAFGAKAGTPLDFAGFLVVFSATHFFLDSASFDKLSETTHRLLDGLPLT
jgi:hypothetical protein